MEKVELAKQLRQRQKGLVEEIYLNVVPDDKIISSYIICPDCKNKMIDDEDLETCIKLSNDAKDFLNMTEKYSRAICDNNKCQSNKENEKYKDLPNYVACLTTYYDSKDNKRKNGEFCRMTIAVTNLKTDKLDYQKEYWLEKENRSVNEIADEIIENIKKFNCTLMNSDASIPLVKCDCGCGGYLFDFMSRENYLDFIRDYKEPEDDYKEWNDITTPKVRCIDCGCLDIGFNPETDQWVHCNRKHALDIAKEKYREQPVISKDIAYKERHCTEFVKGDAVRALKLFNIDVNSKYFRNKTKEAEKLKKTLLKEFNLREKSSAFRQG